LLRLNGSDGEDQPGGQADPTVGAIVFDVVFSEPVFGFAAGDVLLSGTAGATTATVSGSGTYTVAVTDITGQTDPLQVTMDEMLVVCKALHHGSARVLMSCDLRFGRVQESPEAALSAGQRQRRSLPIGNLMQSLQSKCSA
jgi:hypothetical protein